MKQRTIKSAVTFSGVGLHTGAPVNMVIHPAAPDYGVRFQRIDLEGQPFVAADVDCVTSTQRGTTLKQGTATVATIEHTLSALTGLGIDNVLITLDGPEIPIMDGSALPFYTALSAAGLEEQEVNRNYFIIEEPLHFKDDETGAEFFAFPDENYQATVMIDFKSPVLGMQYATLNNLEEYGTEIAPARTFVFLHELEQLLTHNLIKGGDVDNAVIIVDRLMAAEDLDRLAAKLGKPSIKVEQEGVLNTTSLRFNNEPARHKLLDLIGDLSLVGCRIKGRIVATKPGHTANTRFAKMLKVMLRNSRKMAKIPKYDLSTKALLEVVDIEKQLPHRFPFLLIDRIIELSDTHVVGVKAVTYNEHFFQGHFPNNPVMPGVLQIEAMAQTGGILALSMVEDPENWDAYFLKIENAKFKNKVIPGDTIIFRLELLSPIRRGLCHMMGTAYVGNKIVSEGELLAQIIRRSKV